jgi:CubicO group peptidase (beta-lactamase class C family)
MTPETVFAIGSTTKAMTSMLVASLVDDGLLQWDQPVIEIWPGFKLSDPMVTPQIRVRDLLNMSSGLPRADLAWSGVELTAEQIMESLAELPVVAPRGQRFQYNNQMVATGGYVATLAAGGEYGHLGNAYADLLQTRVFEPINMRSASLSVEAIQATPNHAIPHDFTLTGEVLPTHYHADVGIAPAGAVNANVTDLARFLITQLNRGIAPDGTRVVSVENLVETWQPQIEAFQDTSYGMGWFVESYHDVEMIWHEGDVLGFKSLLVFIPEANVGLVLLTNRTISVGFSSSVRYRLIETLYGLDVEAGTQYKTQWDAFIEALPGIRGTVTANAVAPYLGQYTEGWRVERWDDGTLWAIRGPYQWQLLAGENGEFIVNNGFGITTPLQFAEDETGTMRMTFKLSTGEMGEYHRLKR